MFGGNSQLENACQLANIAAGIVVEKVGTAVVTEIELYQAVHVSQQFNSTLLIVEQLSILLAQIEYRQQTTILIYGCFDVLTASHVAFIKKIKRQTQHLIIAVTDKKTSLNNKGKTVNELNRRIVVISALENVDWVVAVNNDDLSDLKNINILLLVLMPMNTQKLKSLALWHYKLTCLCRSFRYLL